MEQEHDLIQSMAEQLGQLTARLQRAGSDTSTMIALSVAVGDIASDLRKAGALSADGLTVKPEYKAAYEKGLREG